MFFQVLDLAANIASQIPENIDYDTTVKILSVDPSPLNVVLLQEVRTEAKPLQCCYKQLYTLGRVCHKDCSYTLKCYYFSKTNTSVFFSVE